MNNDLLVILGPTASGKTALSVAVAKDMNADIISADSRQVYQGMDIGTGKDLGEYGEIPYHLIDIIKAGEKYNLAQYVQDFEKVYNSIIEKDKSVILCGGSGSYIQAVIDGYTQMQIPENMELRQKLAFKDLGELLLKLEEFRPINTESASSKKRLIRAIEKETFLAFNPQFKFKESPIYNSIIFGLNPETSRRRKLISQRLNKRIDEQSMIAEVKSLLISGVSEETLIYYGLEYKYIMLYLNGVLSLDQMRLKLETEIHRFAKRQMTFFRSMERKGTVINWISDGLSIEGQKDFVLHQLELKKHL